MNNLNQEICRPHKREENKWNPPKKINFFFSNNDKRISNK